MLKTIFSIIGFIVVVLIICQLFWPSTHECQICKNYKGSQEQIKQHFNEKHPYKCSNCENFFGTKIEIVNHLKQNHTLYKCPLKMCDFLTYNKKEIEFHLLEEKIDFLFICEFLRNYNQSSEHNVEDLP